MNKTRITILICVLLVLVTLVAYWRVLGAQFVDYDDDVYVTENHWVQCGLTVQSVKWAVSSLHSANWHPLTWISHMLDYSIYGMNPFGHHLTNLILHILSAILLYLLLQRMTGRTWAGAFVAALFAVHPLHVESVAWVAERKDVLSAFFWMLTLHAYVSYVRRPGLGLYLAALLVFALGLMSKPMLVTLPLMLLILDYWPLGRLDFGKPKPTGRVRTIWKLVWEKTPFLALSVASCIVTFIAQQRGGAVMGVENASVGVRLANALVSYVAYLVKMLWPAKLACLYPHPFDSIPTWQVIGSALLLTAISILVIRLARPRPYLAVGWLWYVITLIPVIGLVQVGGQAMADRYTYVPLIGIFIALAWGIGERMGEWENGRMGEGGSPTPPFSHSPILCLPAVLIIAACAVGTWHQTGYWKDSVTLFGRAIGVTERNHIAETSLGLALNKQGKFEESIAHFQAAIRIKPAAKPYDGMGVALVQMDRLAEATASYERAIELEPTSAKTHSNLGFALMDMGRVDEAVGHFRESVKLDSTLTAPHFGLGIAYTQKGQLDAAIREYRKAVSLDPNNAQAYIQLGEIRLRQGETDQAIEYLETAARISPDPVTHYRLGSILAQQQRFDEAIEHFRSAIRLKPDYPQAHYDLGVALSVKGRMDEAIEQYSQAVKIAPDYAKAHMNLAIALYFRGDYAKSWKEVGLARKYGAKLDPEFVKELSSKMPPR